MGYELQLDVKQIFGGLFRFNPRMGYELQPEGKIIFNEVVRFNPRMGCELQQTRGSPKYEHL